MVAEILSLSLVSLSAIFFVVDPLSAVPFFLAMTRGEGPEARRDTALRAALTAGIVLAAFAIAGSAFLRLLGITLAAFNFAVCVLLLLLALDMIRIHLKRTPITEKEVEA